MLSDTVNMLRTEIADVRADEPLSKHCTFRVGGNADIALFPADLRELESAVRILREDKVKYTVAGHGSNILFTDAGYRGAVIFTVGMNGIAFDGGRVTCGAGLSMRRLAETAGILRGYAGFEFMHGIPGTVGGGIYMNAGAYGGEIAGILAGSTYFDTGSGEIRTLDADAHGFGYRFSSYQLHPERVIVSADFGCVAGDPEKIKREINELSEKRRAKQPLNYPNAGSVFKRPDGYIAAKLIDDAGLKGLTVGGASVSELHAGFIINRGGATAKDILDLIGIVKERVFDASGVKLECEIRIVGD